MINSFYKNKDILEKIKKSYKENNPNHVLLLDFFEKDFYLKLKNKSHSERVKLEKTPNKFSYEELNSNSFEEVVDLRELNEFIGKILSRKTKLSNLRIRKFSHKDYTIIHDEQEHSEQEKFILFIPSREVFNLSSGGQKVFQLDGGKENIKFTPKENSLVLIKQGKEDYDFIQYLNNLVGKESLIVVEGVLS